MERLSPPSFEKETGIGWAGPALRAAQTLHSEKENPRVSRGDLLRFTKAKMARRPDQLAAPVPGEIRHGAGWGSHPAPTWVYAMRSPFS